METIAFSGMAGALLSLIFAYVPGAKTWFETLGGDQRRAVMLLALLAVVVIQFGLACAGWAADFGLTATCDRPGLVELIAGFLAALTSNQGVYQLTPASKKR